MGCWKKAVATINRYYRNHNKNRRIVSPFTAEVEFDSHTRKLIPTHRMRPWSGGSTWQVVRFTQFLLDSRTSHEFIWNRIVFRHFSVNVKCLPPFLIKGRYPIFLVSFTHEVLRPSAAVIKVSSLFYLFYETIDTWGWTENTSQHVFSLLLILLFFNLLLSPNTY